MSIIWWNSSSMWAGTPPGLTGATDTAAAGRATGGVAATGTGAGVVMGGGVKLGGGPAEGSVTPGGPASVPAAGATEATAGAAGAAPLLASNRIFTSSPMIPSSTCSDAGPEGDP